MKKGGANPFNQCQCKESKMMIGVGLNITTVMIDCTLWRHVCACGCVQVVNKWNKVILGIYGGFFINILSVNPFVRIVDHSKYLIRSVTHTLQFLYSFTRITGYLLHRLFKIH